MVDAQQAEFYVLDTSEDDAAADAAGQLCLRRRRTRSASAIELGEGLVGQCALEKQKILLDQRAAGLHPHLVRPGRSAAAEHHRAAGHVRRPGQAACSSWRRSSGFNPTHQAFLDQLTESIGIVLNTIEANMRTEDLLKQSQSLAQELQTRQEELQQTNEELQEKARLLAHQNQEVERKNQRSRAGPPGAGREGQAARPDVEVQVRVPGEHVARAAHAAQQPADPLRPAVEEPRRQPDAPSRPSSPRRSTRPATTC